MAKRLRDVCVSPESECRIDAAGLPTHTRRMAKKISGAKTSAPSGGAMAGGASVPASREQSSRATARGDARPTTKPAKPSSLLDTRVIYCGDNLEQLAKLPDVCVDLIYIVGN